MLELGCSVELIESRAGSWVEEVGMVTDFQQSGRKEMEV